MGLIVSFVGAGIIVGLPIALAIQAGMPGILAWPMLIVGSFAWGWFVADIEKRLRERPR